MAVINGTEADDNLVGTAEADSIHGNGGSDRIDAGAGNDTVYGGPGRDIIHGGLGNDLLDAGDGGGELHGEEGDDTLIVSSSSDASYAVSGGDGDDLADLMDLGGSASIALGAGLDTLRLGERLKSTIGTASIAVEDFQTGSTGDKLDFAAFLASALVGWSGANPFGTGHLRLVQSGTDTLLQIDRDAAGTFASFATLVTFKNSDAASFTAENFGGYPPDGSPAGKVIDGTESDDTLAGTIGDDTISGYGGADRIEAGAGHDTVHGGPGIDVIYGGPGDDVLDAGDGGGELRGEDGNDTLKGGSGSDTIYDGRGNDIVEGGAGDDTLINAGLYRDGAYIAASGSDTLDGGDGNDQIWVGRSQGTADAVTVYGGPGHDQLEVHDDQSTFANRYLIDGGPGHDTFKITSYHLASLTILAGDGDDTVNLRDLGGSASITLGGGVDTLTLGRDLKNKIGVAIAVEDFQAGATGDRLDFRTFLSAALSNSNGGNPFATGHLKLVQSGTDTLLQIDRDGTHTYFGFSTLVTFRNANAASFTAENLDGFAPASISGSSGNEVIDGTSGNEVFYLDQGGDDTTAGNAGNDLFYFGGALTAADNNDGGIGTDTLVLQGNYPSLTLGPGSVTGIEGISLQSGTIARWGQSGTNSYDFNIKTVQANVAAGQQLRINAQSLVAGEDFTFDGSAETDGGKFLIYAGYGVENLTGGSAGDVFFFEAGRFGPADKVNGGAGPDAVVISGTHPSVSGPLVLEIPAGAFTEIESLSFNGRYASDPKATPSYQIVLKDGNIAPGASLIVNASSLGSAQSLSFDGSAVATGKLTMFGGAGADTLKGGKSNDLFYAAGGADTLTGGAGADVFQYRDPSDSTTSAADRILDFEAGTDRIDLSRIDANSIAAADQSFTFIGSAAFTGTAGQLRASASGSGYWNVEGDANGDGAADFLIQVTTLQGAALSAADFML